MIEILLLAPLVAAIVAAVRNLRGRAAGIWLVVFMVLPVVFLITAYSIGGALGCTVSEGGPVPCLVGGLDIGGPLTHMGVSGWYMMLSAPLGAVLLVVWSTVRRTALNRAR